MKVLLVRSKSHSEMKFISQLLIRLGVPHKALEMEVIENRGMSTLMKGLDRSKKVTREAVMKKLKSK